MSLIAIVPQRELAFQANLAFEGETYKLFLAQNSGSLTAESDLSAWEAVECSGGGYAAATGTIGTGSWNVSSNRYEPPLLVLTVTATGAGFNYDSIVLRVGSTRANIAGLVTLPSTVALVAGQSRTYNYQLVQAP
jgi:hypothetical protein